MIVRQLLAAACCAITAGIVACDAPAPAGPAAQTGQVVLTGFGQPQISGVPANVPIIPLVKVINFGNLIYSGKMDVNPTLARIRKGEAVREKHDGGIFTNSQHVLPAQKDRDYYLEFVHAPAGFPFPGPQRLVIGKNGIVFYTGDHYATFTRVN